MQIQVLALIALMLCISSQLRISSNSLHLESFKSQRRENSHINKNKLNGNEQTSGIIEDQNLLKDSENDFSDSEYSDLLTDSSDNEFTGAKIEYVKELQSFKKKRITNYVSELYDNLSIMNNRFDLTLWNRFTLQLRKDFAVEENDSYFDTSMFKSKDIVIKMTQNQAGKIVEGYITYIINEIKPIQ